MKIKILFLSANPATADRLSLDEEVRAITQKVRASAHRDLVEIITVWAVRPDDLIQALNEHEPHIVHFSGHGSNTEEIILNDHRGNPTAVSKRALLSLFRTLKDNVQVVVLNACYSKPQAEAIIEVIPCAVGMNQSIGDDAAITFAASFYRAVGFGRSIRDAFDQGITALLLAGIPEENTPELLTQNNVDASRIILVNPT
jgi:CHAT domain-containing protein